MDYTFFKVDKEEKDQEQIEPKPTNTAKPVKPKKKIVPKPTKPKTPKTPAIESNINKMMEDLAKTSEFKRLIYKALVGKVHRGSSANLDQELENYLGIFRKGIE